MKIVFIQPNVGFKGHTWESLAVGYLSAYLKKNGYNDVEFYSAFYDDDKTILDACKDANIVGVSCTSPQFKHGVELARQIKTENNRIIFGGVHPSALPQIVLEEKSIDAVCIGEGEKPMLQFVRDVENKVDIPKHIYGPDFVQDINSLPFPDRNVIKNERNIQQAYKDTGERITSILSSRACPFNCSFCCSHVVFGRKVRLRSPENILDELQVLIKDWKIQFLKFSDDTFTVDKQRVADFCNLKLERGLTIPYGANAHINTMDETVLKQLAESNCRELWYGVESGSPKILKDMNKHTNIDRIKEIFKLTKNYGIKTRAYFLLGMPNETAEDIHLTEKLCDEIEPDMVGFTLLAPFPRNMHYNHEEMKSWDWSKFDEYGNNWIKTNTLSNEYLKKEQRRLVEKYEKAVVFRQKSISV